MLLRKERSQPKADYKLATTYAIAAIRGEFQLRASYTQIEPDQPSEPPKLPLG